MNRMETTRSSAVQSALDTALLRLQTAKTPAARRAAFREMERLKARQRSRSA